MEIKEKFFDLIYRLQAIPVGHDTLLDEFLTQLKAVIEETFTAESQYLNYLRFIRFKPDAVFVTDKERERSWHNGTNQVDNLLRVMINDPKVRGDMPSSPADGVSSPFEEQVRHSLTELNMDILDRQQEIQETASGQLAPGADVLPSPKWDDSVTQSLGDLKNSIAEEHPELKAGLLPSVSGESSGPGPAVGVGTVLIVSSHDESLNEEVREFLRALPVNAVGIPQPVGQESLTDRINRCLSAEFVIFCFLPIFLVYPRDQRPVDANLAASQTAVFQLGYLAAKYDRQRIVVLYREQEGFLRPTEFFDLFYVPVNGIGAWKQEVLRRMKGPATIAEALGLSQKGSVVLVILVTGYVRCLEESGYQWD